MRRLTFGAAMLTASLALGACANDGPTQADEATADDYSLVYFGAAGAALQSTLGPQGGRPFDGGTGAPRFPEELALSAEQLAAIAALRDEFKADHQADLNALHAIFQQARAAHDAGATRAEVHEILLQGRAIAVSLHSAVHALHEAILGVLTDDQLEWLADHRPRPPRNLDGRTPPDPRGPRPPR